eukprot:scaffold290648_cov19-Tisochrysis_lutea.AAC.2
MRKEGIERVQQLYLCLRAPQLKPTRCPYLTPAYEGTSAEASKVPAIQPGAQELKSNICKSVTAFQ